MSDRYVKPVAWEHIKHVADNMREADQREVLALGHSPLSSLRLSVDNSICCYTLVDKEDEPLALLGVAHSPLGASWGAVWLLGTPLIERYPTTFLRHSSTVLETLYEESNKEVLFNYTHADNYLHHKWLKWLGFKFIQTVPLPPFNERFIAFVKLRG